MLTAPGDDRYVSPDKILIHMSVVCAQRCGGTIHGVAPLIAVANARPRHGAHRSLNYDWDVVN